MNDHYLVWKGWQAGEFGHFGLEDSLTFRRELQASGIDAVKGLKVGELGYGNGVFAGWVQAEGGDWVGRESELELQQRAVQAGFKVLGGRDEFAKAHGPEGLDLIVAFDVLEHLEIDQIRSFLGEAKEALKPGGLLIARFPSGDSPFSGPIFNGDLTHRTLLGSSAIRQLALESGWEVLQIRSPVMPIWGLGPLRAVRRMAVSLLRMWTFAFIRNVVMGQSNAVLSPNLVAVFRKKGVVG